MSSAQSVHIVQNFTLPGEICRKLAADWSADNKISVCTDKAVYIMTSFCSPVETGFPPPLHKQVILAPTKVMDLGVSEVPPELDEMSKTVEEKESIFKIFLDHTVTPNAPDRCQPFLGFRCAKWSPKGAARAGRCLLATLTMDHRLALYEEKDKEWICLIDLSELLKTTNPTEKCSEELKKFVNKEKTKISKEKSKIDLKYVNKEKTKISKEKSKIDLENVPEMPKRRGRPPKNKHLDRRKGVTFKTVSKKDDDPDFVESKPVKRLTQKLKNKVNPVVCQDTDSNSITDSVKKFTRRAKQKAANNLEKTNGTVVDTAVASTSKESEDAEDSEYEDMEASSPAVVKKTFPKKKIIKKSNSKHRYQGVAINRAGGAANKKDDSHCEKKLSFLSILDADKMRNDVYRLAAMEVTWTGMFGSPATSMNDSSYEYCYLIVGMKSGHIQFWKISPNDGKMVSLTCEWDTGLDVLTSLCWQQTSPSSGFLMVGCWKGILAFVPISVRTYANQEPQLVVKEVCQVWNEEDNIAVDHISILKTALKKYVMIAAKQHALVACEIVLTDSSIIIRNVGHSFGLHNFPITGMCVLDSSMPQYRILISTLEGILVEIKVSVGNDDITFQHEKLNLDLNFTNMVPQGIAVSGNGILCALIMKTAVYYDHLSIKEPLRFALFVLKPYEEIYSKLKGLLKPQFSFLPASSNTITKHADFLECIRINLANNTSLPEWMTSFLDNDPNTYENFSTLELYFIRFLLNAYVSGLAVAAPKDKGNLELKLFTVDAIIMRNYISKVFGSCNDKIDLLTPAQGQSLLLMADWLFKEFQMPVESLYTALGFETPEDPEELPAREVCRICKGEVRLDSVKTGQCENSHMFGRCCQSLLLCDVIPYYRCNSCKSIALQDVWNFGLTCTYCGMTMI